MKLTKLTAVLVLLTLGSASVAAESVAELEKAGNEDPQAWYAAAVAAREAGELATAKRGIERAVELGLSPLRAGFERARIAVVAGDRELAVDELQALADAGFTSVDAISGDPVLSDLRGYPAFDAYIDTLSVSAYPCAHQAQFREFDFWIGDWEVHMANGTLAGHNTIERAERGCVLLENWTSATGGTGMSINYLDHASGEWVQVWNAAGGSQINIRGGLTDDGMLLEGQIHYVGNGTTAPFRGLWTELPDGRVRQYFEQSNDDGETWSPWFEGFYSRSDNAD